MKMNSPCVICLDVLVGSEICVTPCGHVFHSKCIFRWIDSSEACPECRRNLTKDNVIKLNVNANDLDSKKGEAIVSKLSLAKAKIKALEEQLSKKEEEYETIQHKCLETELELASTTCELRRGVLQVYLKEEEDILERQFPKTSAINILDTTRQADDGTYLSDNTDELPFVDIDYLYRH